MGDETGAGASQADVGADEAVRSRGIVRVSTVGIIVNAALAAVKALAGMAANSIAVTLDAVNNLSDAVSSVITIVGTRLAGRRADHDHPYGYGRIEYMTTIVIGVIVLWAGVTALGESAGRIARPDTPSYDVVTLSVVGIGVIAKVSLGLYTRMRGARLSSGALVASGTDALTDAALSAATLASAFVSLAFGVNVDAWLGAIIALVIVRAGLSILHDALNHVLGERVDADVASAVRRCVNGVAGVRGSYDLILNDYGPSRLWGSIHVEVDDSMTARDIDALARTITRVVYEQTGVILHTVGVYSFNANDTEAAWLRGAITRIALSHEYVLQVHGFYLDEESATASFDIVVSFDAPSRLAVYNAVVADVRRRYPDYAFKVALDSDVSG